MAWKERNREHPNYRRMDYVQGEHCRRYRAYVKAHGMPCQDCHGRGCHGYDSYEYGPAEPCGWCETTGLVTRWVRGLWLRTMREEKRKARQRRTAVRKVA